MVLQAQCTLPLYQRVALLTLCDGCWEDCVGAHCCIAGIAIYVSVILSRGRLVTVEVPGYPSHPSYI